MVIFLIIQYFKHADECKVQAYPRNSTLIGPKRDRKKPTVEMQIQRLKSVFPHIFNYFLLLTTVKGELFSF